MPEPPSRPRGRSLGRGVELRPGAVRDARAEAGLSLAQVAGGEVTRAAIHRIEKGQIRPSMPTLELIARRTGKPVEFFLADLGGSGSESVRNDMQRLDELSVTDDLAAIAALGARLLERLRDPGRRATAALITGSALVRLDRHEEGLALLEEAREHHLAIGDAWSAVDAQDMIGLSYSSRHDPRAQSVLEQALAECRRLDPPRPDLESRIHRHFGSHYVRAHEWQKSIEAYERALEAAGPLRQLGALARMYAGLATAYEQLGDLSRAASYSHRALAVHELDHDRRAIARIENNLGLVLLRSGQIERAEEHLRRSLGLSEELGLEVGRAHVLLSLAELELAREDPGAAEGYARQALATAESAGERLSEASAQQLLAMVDERRGARDAADLAWHRAIDILTELGATKRLMECHSRYSEILEARGEAAAALQHTRMALALADPSLGAAQGEEEIEADLRAC